MRKIGVVSVARSDYAILHPVLRELQSRPGLTLHLIVAGMHLAPEFGHTVDAIVRDGFEPHDRVEMLLASDTPEGIAKSIGLGSIGFAQCYTRAGLDVLLVLGDRFEVLAAVAAALPFRLPVAHIAGGEVTEGSLDDCIRHAVSKMSHLHFVSTEPYRERLIQMGEEPWRVHVTGSPSIDRIMSVRLLSHEQIEGELGFDFRSRPLLVTLHPETQSDLPAEEQIGTLLAALEDFGDLSIIFTASNADQHGRLFMERIRSWVRERRNATLVPNLGGQLFFSILSESAALVGNSSSGIVEAPSFRVPVVNIGSRQHGRPHSANVIDVPFQSGAIREAIRSACSRAFRESLSGLENLFGDGHASKRIVDQLESVELGHALLCKKFVSAATAAPETAAMRAR